MMTHSIFDQISKLRSHSGASIRREKWHKPSANQNEQGWIAQVHRVRGYVEQWIRNRVRECVRCRGCQSEVLPFETICPTCGQANPAKVSPVAVVYLAIGFAILTFTLWLIF
jgi:hypothetical protein